MIGELLEIQDCDLSSAIARKTKSALQILKQRRLLTPKIRDSSRFWDATEWKAGTEAPSYDKQFVRDYLTSSGLKGKPNVSHIAGLSLSPLASSYSPISAWEKTIRCQNMRGRVQNPAP